MYRFTSFPCYRLDVALQRHPLLNVFMNSVLFSFQVARNLSQKVAACQLLIALSASFFHFFKFLFTL